MCENRMEKTLHLCSGLFLLVFVVIFVVVINPIFIYELKFYLLSVFLK